MLRAPLFAHRGDQGGVARVANDHSPTQAALTDVQSGGGRELSRRFNRCLP
jgi:hypothetical protein